LLACQSADLDLDHAALLDDATSATVADPRDASRGSPLNNRLTLPSFHQRQGRPASPRDWFAAQRRGACGGS
jgi:hypothetical protein